MLDPTAVTRPLATYAAKLRFRDLPAEVVDVAKTAVLNILAAALGGTQTRLGGVHVALARELGGGARQATLLASRERVSRPAAAYANSSLAFALDYEDFCEYVLHPGPIVVPAALAIAEPARLDGRRLLAAVVAGYEVGTRIGRAMQPTPERAAQVWGQQYTPFAACAAVGNLLGLAAPAMDVAFGVAGTYAPVPSGLKYFGGVAETRPMREAKLGWGWMAFAGTMGALSAAAGMRGGHGMLDGRHGFWIMAGSDRCDFPKMLQGLGSEWLILGTDFKMHPSIAWNHPPYLVLRRLMAEHALRPAQVGRVRIWNVGAPRIADYAPAGAVDAQFSLPYMAATTLLGLPLTPQLYAERTLRSPRVRAMLRRIECLPDPQMDHDWFAHRRNRTRVEIALTDGRTLEASACFPADKPPYGRAEVIGKFQAMAEGVLPCARIRRVVDAVEQLDRLDDAGVLVRLLAPHARRTPVPRARPRRRPARTAATPPRRR